MSSLRGALQSTQYGGVTGYETRLEIELEIDELYDFLYEHEYPTWFLILVKKISIYNNKRALKEFIMCLHTGESLSEVLRKWTRDQIENEGQQLLRRLCQDIVAWYESPSIDHYKKDDVAELIPTLVAELELDGYIHKKGKLYYSEANVLDEGEEEGILDGLILDTSLENKDVMDHCLALSEADYLEQKWDDSIGNSRKFLESVLKEIADKYEFNNKSNHLDESIYDRAVKVRIYLTNNNLLTPDEVTAFEHVYGLLSETGSHPNIAENDQASLARNLALTLAQFILLRYKGYMLGQAKVASE